MKSIFITGATGFLGSYILKELLDDEDVRPIVLVRSKKGESAATRIGKVLKYFYGNDRSRSMAKRLKVVEGEIDKKDFGVDAKTKEFLTRETDEIYHSAAIAEFKVPLAQIRKSNVDGTKNVLEFASECKERGHLKRVNHVSTAYVAGTCEGIFRESDLDMRQGFNNTYEQTKFEAEKVVMSYMKNGLEITVFRPSILTGDYMNGKTSNFKMLYQPLHFFASELFDVVPGDANTDENLMPVDIVAKAIYLIANEKECANRRYHIANISTVKVGHFFDMASDFFGFKSPEFVPYKEFNMGRLTAVQQRLIEPYIPYFNYKTYFDSTEARKVLERKKFRYPAISDDFLLRLFKFCADSGFVKPRRRYVVAG